MLPSFRFKTTIVKTAEHFTWSVFLLVSNPMLNGLTRCIPSHPVTPCGPVCLKNSHCETETSFLIWIQHEQEHCIVENYLTSDQQRQGRTNGFNTQLSKSDNMLLPIITSSWAPRIEHPPNIIREYLSVTLWWKLLFFMKVIPSKFPFF